MQTIIILIAAFAHYLQLMSLQTCDIIYIIMCKSAQKLQVSRRTILHFLCPQEKDYQVYCTVKFTLIRVNDGERRDGSI